MELGHAFSRYNLGTFEAVPLHFAQWKVGNLTGLAPRKPLRGARISSRQA